MSSKSKSDSDSDDGKYSPKGGVFLDLEGANLILQRHLSQSCKSIQEIAKRGYNNRTYIVSGDQENKKYVIRLQGIHWTKVKTECEVAAILFLQKSSVSIPLPQIYGFCSSKELSGIGNEYILMEFFEGVPLDEVFLKMDLDVQKDILTQFAQIVAEMNAIKFDQIGSLVFKSKVSDTYGIGLKMEDISLEDIQIGPVLDQQVGPFNNWLEYYKALCEKEVEQLKIHDFMKEQLKNLPRIENFIKSITDPARTPLPKEVQDVEFVFIQGDLESRNMMVKDGKIVGLLDFEFAGAFPVDNAWYDGFIWSGGNTAEAYTFGQENGEPDKTTPPEELKNYFLNECKKLNIPTPNVIPGHFQRAELYCFMVNISPWYLRIKRDNIPKDWFEERDNAMKRVDSILSKYGF